MRYFQVAAEIERRAAGEEPAAMSAEDVADRVDVATLSDEDRRNRMKQLRRELERRLAEDAR